MAQAENRARARIVCFGEILLRLAAPRPQILGQGPLLESTYCGAEANVTTALAGFGHDCCLVTALPANALGDCARQAVQAFGAEVSAPAVEGGRMGLYFLQPGAMARPSAIIYDRAGSAFAMAGPDAYDWPSLLNGADWLFVSGITAALGDGPLAALREAIEEARRTGMRVAFDTNFRPALWRGREQQAAAILRDLSCKADLVFAGRRAIAMMAGGNFDHADPQEGFAAAAQAMFDLSPTIRHIAATRRTVHSTDRQDITGLLADRAGISSSATIRLENIVDRVGTGDSFAAGIVHGLASGLGREGTIAFAMACSQWAHSIKGDMLRASVSDIVGLAKGGGDVKR